MSIISSLILAATLLSISALFSGLTLGLLSFSVEELRRKAKLGNAEAKLVYPLRARNYELLIALIIGNVISNAALTVVLAELMPNEGLIMPFLAVAISTVLITFFAEILPKPILKGMACG